MTAGMASRPNQTGLGWGSRLLIAIALVLVGAAGAAWGLARYHQAARFLGVAPAPVPAAPPQRAIAVPLASETDEADKQRIGHIEQRLNQVERSTQRVEG